MTERPDDRERVIRGMPFEKYAKTKALSASGAWALSEECPARFWWSSPWNPQREPENALHFDIGKALHLAVLQPEELADSIVRIDANDYRTRIAQTQRDDAYAAGKTPLLAKEVDLIGEMDRAVHADPHAAELLESVENEVSFFWADPQTGTRCMARAYKIDREQRVIIDLKTAVSAAPGPWARAAWRDGYFLRAPWYLDGWTVATGEVMQRYAFIVVEKEKPHIVAVYYLSDRALSWGRMMVRRALSVFAECKAANAWTTGFPSPATIDLPTWSEFQLADREQAGDFKSSYQSRATSAAVRRGNNFLAP